MHPLPWSVHLISTPTENFHSRNAPSTPLPISCVGWARLGLTAVLFSVDLINQSLCSVHVLSKPLGDLSLSDMSPVLP